MLYLSFRRNTLLSRLAKYLAFVVILWTTVEVLYVRNALIREACREPPPFRDEKVFIASIHWNNEEILRKYWIPAVVDLVKEIGPDNVYVSVQESGSWDDSKGALRVLDQHLEALGVARRIVLDKTTHADEIAKAPAETGWIRTPRDKVELRRIPYLAKLRNLVMQPLYDLQHKDGTKFDRILWLNDVVFDTEDVRRLLSTRDGDYAAACSLDFSRPSAFYDTFALRDAEGHDELMQTWPFFRARKSRQALKSSRPVPVASCWNGIVAMEAAPFYADEPLAFRGISDSLAKSHLEGSECCLIHADNPLLPIKGVWLNPNVRVGYNGPAYEAVNTPSTSPWVSALSIVYGSWANRVLRWTTTPWFTERTVRSRVAAWQKRSERNMEKGVHCLINEMQVLISNGWAHV